MAIFAEGLFAEGLFAEGLFEAVSPAAPPIWTATPTPPELTVGEAITPIDLTASTDPDGTSYSIVSGTLPAGLLLDSGTGVISGTPTSAGGYATVVRATNADGAADSGSVSWTVVAAPDVLSVVGALPSPLLFKQGKQIAPIDASPIFSGGAENYEIIGSIPAGLALNTSTGVISGTPTATPPASGSFRVQANKAGETSVQSNLVSWTLSALAVARRRMKHRMRRHILRMVHRLF